MISNEEIMNELQTVKILLKAVLQRETESGIEEISLTKAAKLLHKSTDTVKELVEKGDLKAFKEVKSDMTIEYRFLISEIRNYQNQRRYSINTKTSFDVQSLVERIKGSDLPDVPERKRKHVAA